MEEFLGENAWQAPEPDEARLSGLESGLVVNANPLGAEAEKGEAQRIKLKDQTGPALVGPRSPEGLVINLSPGCFEVSLFSFWSC